MPRNKGQKASNVPSEDRVAWDYSCVGRDVPRLVRGSLVLVDYFGRNRVAVVQGRIPGSVYWAQLCAPVNGSTRVIVSKHSFKGVAKNA